MSGFDPSSIDWSDPIEANRQLKLQLAKLEAAQEESRPEAGGDGGDYGYDGDEHSGYAARLDYDPRYIDEGHDMHDRHKYDETTMAAMDAYDRGHGQNSSAAGEYIGEPPEARRRRLRRKKKKPSVKNAGQIRRKPQRANMTFDSAKCRDIDRGNINLLQRLSSIHNRKSTTGSFTGKTRRGGASNAHKKKGSASINMRRKQNKIAMENRKFAQRLQSVRGTKSLSKKNLRKHAVRSKKFAELGREVPGRKMSRRERLRQERELREERESGWQ
eukprot:g4350.t1